MASTQRGGLLALLVIAGAVGLATSSSAVRAAKLRIVGSQSKINRAIDCVIESKTMWTDFVRDHLAETYTGHFNRDEPLTPVLIELAKRFQEEYPSQPVLMVDVGAARCARACAARVPPVPLHW